MIAPGLREARPNCLRCHTMGAVGGREGPVLSTVGDRLDEAGVARQIATPLDVKSTGEMPAFADKLSPEEIGRLAKWVSRKVGK